VKELPSEAGNARGVYALLNAATDSQIALTALKVAIVVGIFLNIINQGPRLMEGDGVNWVQVILNFLVPYCVASYSGAKNELSKHRQVF
jgi:hypothetical protein